MDQLAKGVLSSHSQPMLILGLGSPLQSVPAVHSCLYLRMFSHFFFLNFNLLLDNSVTLCFCTKPMSMFIICRGYLLKKQF